MMGVSEEALLKTLIDRGVDEEFAKEQIANLSNPHPYLTAGSEIARRLRKLESLLNVQRDLSGLSSFPFTVKREKNLSRTQFLDDYYAINRPVILKNLMCNWRALKLWNPQYLKSVCGNQIVEVMTGRESDPLHDINLDAHRTTMPMGEYVDMVLGGGLTNDYYMVANNFFLQNEGAKQLFADMEIFPEYLDPKNLDGTCSFWFGPAGTITPLHHDTINILMAQVYGRKHVTLIPSLDVSVVYNNVGVYSAVDIEDPDYETYPLFKQARVMELMLEPGEVLFIPAGWWHRVKALDISITVSFINFLFPNSYEWTDLA